MIIYVCHPFRAKDLDGIKDNINKAIEWGKRLHEQGFTPLVPHINSQVLFGFEGDNETVTEYDNDLLFACDIMAVCGSRISEGMKHEIELCEEWGIPHVRINNDVGEVINNMKPICE